MNENGWEWERRPCMTRDLHYECMDEMRVCCSCNGRINKELSWCIVVSVVINKCMALYIPLVRDLASVSPGLACPSHFLTQYHFLYFFLLHPSSSFFILFSYSIFSPRRRYSYFFLLFILFLLFLEGTRRSWSRERKRCVRRAASSSESAAGSIRWPSSPTSDQ